MVKLKILEKAVVVDKVTPSTATVLSVESVIYV